MPARRTSLCLATWVALVIAGPAPGQTLDDLPERPTVIVVSRDAILRDTAAGRAIREAERELGARFQARVDAAKAEIDAEEAELTELRTELGREEFERRAARFDRKVRIARRRSQQQAAELQSMFRQTREEVSARLGPILIDILRAEGASIVLDAGQVLIAAPSVNMTQKAIELFDERVEPPKMVLPEGEPIMPTEAEIDAATEPQRRQSSPD